MKKIYMKLLFVLMSFLISVYLSLPNFLENKSYLPSSKLNLGLDIRGGVSILLEADLSAHQQEQMISIRQAIANGIRLGKQGKIKDDTIILNQKYKT